MDGVKDAVETVKEIVVPWRRKNAERIASLENTLRQVEIQRINAETLIAKVKADRERVATELDKIQGELTLSQAKKTEAEAALILVQAEKMRVEIEKERASLRQAQIELAMQIIERFSPLTDGVQKMDYVIRLLPVLDRLLSSEIEPR